MYKKKSGRSLSSFATLIHVISKACYNELCCEEEGYHCELFSSPEPKAQR